MEGTQSVIIRGICQVVGLSERAGLQVVGVLNQLKAFPLVAKICTAKYNLLFSSVILNIYVSINYIF